MTLDAPPQIPEPSPDEVVDFVEAYVDACLRTARTKDDHCVVWSPSGFVSKKRSHQVGMTTPCYLTPQFVAHLRRDLARKRGKMKFDFATSLRARLADQAKTWIFDLKNAAETNQAELEVPPQSADQIH